MKQLTKARIQQPAIEVESTTNGIWLRIGKEEAILFTTEAATLLDHLKEAMQHCCKKTIHPAMR